MRLLSFLVARFYEGVVQANELEHMHTLLSTLPALGENADVDCVDNVVWVMCSNECGG